MKSNVEAPVIAENDLDLRAALRRRWRWIAAPTILVAVLSAIAVNLIPPRYKSEARIVYDGRENVFLRPEAEKSLLEDRGPADPETLTNQIQIILSRQLALDVIGELKLHEMPEFDPVLRGPSTLRQLLGTAGLARDLLVMSPEERVLESWYDRLAAYAVDKSRVIVVEFQSADPELAALITNTITTDYLRLQQRQRQEQTRDAGRWLSGEIEGLRRKVADAEAKAEEFRSRSNLFVGTNNTTLSAQQLGELNSQLALARAQKADAETRARIIRDMLRSGGPIDASDVINSELIRRLSERQVALRAQLAEQSSTLLDGHPRIKELRAQIADLDRQIRAEAEKLTRSLENDARIAGAKVEALGVNLDALKQQAASTNGQDVEFRALEREAKAQRDLLESYLLRYRETIARESIGSAPADAKVISAAIPSNTPYYPKKLPMVAVASLIALLLSGGLVTTGEVLRAAAPRRRNPLTDAPLAFGPFAETTGYDSVETVAADVDRTHTHLLQGMPRAKAGGPAPASAAPVVAGKPVPAMVEQMPVATAPIMPNCAVTPDGAPPLEPPAPPAVPRSILGVPLGAIQDAVTWLGETDGSGHRLAVFSATAEVPTSLSAVTLARTLAGAARVVVVGLIKDAPVLEAISAWPNMPGLSDVVSGTASFGQIISKDKLSRVHIIPHGRSDLELGALLDARQFAVMMEALRRAYDHVILDAGTLSPDNVRLAAVTARCLLVTRDRDEHETTAAFEALADAGFAEVAILPASAIQPEGRAAA